MRAIHNISYLSHTNDYFKQDKILKAEELFKLQICSKMYAYINSDDNEFRHRHFSFSSIHNHHTRNLMCMQIFHLLVELHTQEASEAVCITMCFDEPFTEN